MPELLQELPPRRTRKSDIDLTQWADGQPWRFVKGEDYSSSTDTFRSVVRRWAKEHGYDVELRPYPALDGEGREVPLSKADGIALGIRFAQQATRRPAR